MKCPNCNDHPLQAMMTKQGVEIDYCDQCKGIWLDKGEIFHFVKHPKKVSKKLDIAIAKAQPGYKISPRSNKPMQQIQYDNSISLDYCPSSGGLWFDDHELKALIHHEKNIKLSLENEQNIHNAYSEPAVQRRKNQTSYHHSDRQRHRALRSGLLKLPNLFLRSSLTLIGLYTILGLVLITAVEFAGVNPDIALMIGIAIVLLQFLISPFIMDISLRWMYHMQWQNPKDLPAHLNHFIDKISQQYKIKYPRIGIIDDGAPQAFTYGHTPGNARIVISRGILELLDPDEVEAVVAHEMGHAIHWDMFLMTVVQLVPLLLYYLYRSMISGRSSNNKSAGAQMAVAAGAYILYIISEYIVLWFSRTREYHADRFAGDVTHNPSNLASALVKIAYGLAGQEKQKPSNDKDDTSQRNHNLEAISALGIFDSKSANAFAISSYSDEAQRKHKVNKDRVIDAMRWDLWNPWAKWYELNSTHPLIAKRLRYLSDQAAHMGKTPYVVFEEKQPESYWDEFAIDILIYLLPVIALLASPIYTLVLLTGGFDINTKLMLGLTLLPFGLALLLKYRFSYKQGFFPTMSVASLLKRVKVSAIRPVPCKVEGMIIGRGVPGYIFSEDFVLKDSTGIIFLDYRQPLAIWEWFFSLLGAQQYHGQSVTVEGWYRRSPVPYIEIKTLRSNNNRTRSWVPVLYKLTALTLFAVGFILIMMS